MLGSNVIIELNCIYGEIWQSPIHAKLEKCIWKNCLEMIIVNQHLSNSGTEGI